MSVETKIYVTIFVWLVLSVASLFFVFPKFADGLVALQQTHQSQIDEYNNLKVQIQSLRNMQDELAKISQQPIQPKDLFTSDVKLVKEIQRVENAANSSGLEMALSISGSASTAQAYPGSLSKLLKIPYAVTLNGGFAGVVQFLKYLENSYFISPIGGFDISAGDSALPNKSVTARINSNFFIHTQQ